MAVIQNIYMKRDGILALAKKMNANPEMKGIGIDVVISDEINNYGQNVSAYVSQSKEQRDAKADRYYVANGKVVWKDDKPIVVPPRDGGNSEVPF